MSTSYPTQTKTNPNPQLPEPTRKNRVPLQVLANNGHSQLAFKTSYQSISDVENAFGKMHHQTYDNAVYPFQTCILQFWKALDWKKVSYKQVKDVPTGKFKSYRVYTELIASLEKSSYSTSSLKGLMTMIGEYFKVPPASSWSQAKIEPKKFSSPAGIIASDGPEISAILSEMEVDILEVLKKHTKDLRRQSKDQIFLQQTSHHTRLEIEFDKFIVVVDDPVFAKILAAFEPCVAKIKERVEKLRSWRTVGVPEAERDYKFSWEREEGTGLKPEGFDAPFDHQWAMYKTHTLLNSSADLSQMGTGKTLSCLMTIDKRIQEGKVRKGHIIVVAPTTTLELAWQKQIEKFVPHLTSRIVTGSYADRMEIFMDSAAKRGDILLINYESFAMETKVNTKDGQVKKLPLAKLCELVNWDMVVLDECHKIKNPAAKRTGHLISAFKSARYKMIMSGTINANKLFDIHVPFVHLNNAQNFNSLHHHHDGSELTVGELHGAFKGAYFQGSGITLSPRKGTVGELREKLEEVSVRFEKKECLSLPEKMYVREEIQMSPKQEQLYNALQEALIADLTDIRVGGGTVSVRGILAMLTKLAEAANGWIYNNAHEAITLPWNPKLERTKEIVSEIDLDTQKVVIWSRFTHDLHVIAAELRETYGRDAVVVVHGGGHCRGCGSDTERRTEHVEQFLDMSPGNKVKIIILNQAAGSHGIDLISAAYEIFYSNSFSKTDRLQAEDRCHRTGMRDSLTIIDLVCKNTVDEQVMTALMTHKAMTVALLESLGILFDLNFEEDDAKSDEPPAIQMQKQGSQECLLASCAMVAGKTIEAARVITKDVLKIDPWIGTHSNMMRLLKHWGVSIRKVWDMRDDQKGIASVKWPNQKGHAVAFQGGLVYDPTYEKPKIMQKWLADAMERDGRMSDIWVVEEQKGELN